MQTHLKTISKTCRPHANAHTQCPPYSSAYIARGFAVCSSRAYSLKYFFASSSKKGFFKSIFQCPWASLSKACMGFVLFDREFVLQFRSKCLTVSFKRVQIERSYTTHAPNVHSNASGCLALCIWMSSACAPCLYLHSLNDLQFVSKHRPSEACALDCNSVWADLV